MGNFSLNASGRVNLYKYTPEKELYFTRSNTILPLALDVVARLMGNFAIGNIDTISIYKSGLLLASTPIITYTHSALNQIQYSAIFSASSFSGDFDQIQLSSSAMGPIAELDDVDGTKSGTDQLGITWTITIT